MSKDIVDQAVSGSFFDRLIDVLPKLRTKLQVLALLIVVSGLVAYRAVPPEYVKGISAAGAVGVFLLVFFQLFEKLDRIPSRHRAGTILGVVIVFAIVIIATTALAVGLLIRAATSARPPERAADRRTGSLEVPVPEHAVLKLRSGSKDCTPKPEVCDGLDNDCDGLVDIALVGGGSRVPVCVGGKWPQDPEARLSCDVLHSTTGHQHLNLSLQSPCTAHGVLIQVFVNGKNVGNFNLEEVLVGTTLRAQIPLKALPRPGSVVQAWLTASCVGSEEKVSANMKCYIKE